MHMAVSKIQLVVVNWRRSRGRKQSRLFLRQISNLLPSQYAISVLKILSVCFSAHGRCLLEFMTKKHVSFDQGLEFLILHFTREIDDKSKKNLRKTKKQYEKRKILEIHGLSSYSHISFSKSRVYYNNR